MIFVDESRCAYRCIIPQRGEEPRSAFYIQIPHAFHTRFFASVVLHASRARATDFFGCKYLSHARPRALSGQFNIANADEENWSWSKCVTTLMGQLKFEAGRRNRRLYSACLVLVWAGNSSASRTGRAKEFNFLLCSRASNIKHLI